MQRQPPPSLRNPNWAIFRFLLMMGLGLFFKTLRIISLCVKIPVGGAVSFVDFHVPKRNHKAFFRRYSRHLLFSKALLKIRFNQRILSRTFIAVLDLITFIVLNCIHLLQSFSLSLMVSLTGLQVYAYKLYTISSSVAVNHRWSTHVWRVLFQWWVGFRI